MTHESQRFRLLGADYEPVDLAPQLPREGTLLRRIPGPDSPDYWLAELDAPLAWNDNGSARSIKYLVVTARHQGQTIKVPVQRVITGIAYVVDESLLADETLSFNKCRYVAIGVISGP